MKKYAVAVMLPLVIQACSSGPDYKEARAEVLELHDKVMIDSEKAIRNRMKLDSLSLKMDSLKLLKPGLDTAIVSQKMTALKARLDSADGQMNTWMRAFEAELGDRSNDEAVAYFREEEKKIKRLDSVYADVIKESDAFLSDLKQK
ncbi:hypothetical protein [Arcticibacter sp.]|uniref:hypothetical protein n=1 Tax=Arcticibacter sp. TaxID=1872630 RepID=UPI00388E3AF7